MLAIERHKFILNLLAEKGQVTTTELCDALSVSPATIRNDLHKLHEQNLIHKTHGGATCVLKKDTSPAENDDPGATGSNTFNFKTRENKNSLQKQAISDGALQYIQNNQCILLDGSSTALSLAKKLKNFNKLIVITNGIYTMLTLKENPNITVILIGGIVTKYAGSVEGILGIDLLNHINIDLAFVSANGFTLDEGLTDFNIYEVELKRAMMKSSKRIIALLDSSKFENVSTASFLPSKNIDMILTDDGSDENLLNKYLAKGINIKVCPSR